MHVANLRGNIFLRTSKTVFSDELLIPLLSLDLINFINSLINCILGSISLPFAILASIWSYRVSIFRIAAEFSIAILFSFYILIISILSPCPPFNNWIGGS